MRKGTKIIDVNSLLQHSEVSLQKLITQIRSPHGLCKYLVP